MVASLAFVLMAVNFVCVASDYKVVCYTSHWSRYRPDPVKFLPEHVDPTLCTHLVYAFAKVENLQLSPYEWNDQDGSNWKGMYTRLNDLKLVNPSLKTILSVGGWTHSSFGFKEMVATAVTRRTFIEACIAYLRDTGFDGIDLDWEYPAVRGGSQAQDKQNFVELVKELKESFAKEAEIKGFERLLLSAAVGVDESVTKSAYDIPELARYLDFINLMAYDMHGFWDLSIGHHSPLYGGRDQDSEDKTRNVHWAVQNWKQQIESINGDVSKLVLGVGSYGRSFTVSSIPNGAPSVGKKGPYVQEEGFLAYYEICIMMKATATVVRTDVEQNFPYIVNGDQWVGYDNEHSLREKVDYMKENGLGGMMIWALDLDDFTGEFCGNGKYPLVKAITDALKHVKESPNMTNPNVTSSTVTSSNVPNSFICPGDGLYPEPIDCAKYHNCLNGRDLLLTCAAGTLFNRKISNCDWPSNVKCYDDLSFSCNGASGLFPDPVDCSIFHNCANGIDYTTKCPVNTLFNPILKVCDWADNVQCTPTPS